MIFYFSKNKLKNVAIIFLFILSFMIGFTSYSPKVLDASSHEWGLSFKVDGEAPIPNLSSEDLLPYNAYYKASLPTKNIFITFDAGFENGNTLPILDALDKHNAQAIFFLVGPYMEANPDIVKEIVARGHIVGNHSYSHPDMRNKSKEEFLNDLKKTEQVYESIIGQPMQKKYYRPPEGKFTTENLEWAKEAGYTTLFWSLAYVDWYVDKQPTKEQAFSKLIPRIHDGAIILLHSTSSANAALLDDLLTQYTQLGYTIANIDQIS